MREIKLVESFAGYGSQSMALKNLGFKLSKDSAIIEWTVAAVLAYAAAHHPIELERMEKKMKAFIDEKGKEATAKFAHSKYTLSTEKVKGWFINGEVIRQTAKNKKELTELHGEASYVPMTQEDWLRLSENDLIKIISAMKVSKNIGSIMDVKGEDEIMKNVDIFTYSFPCTDLSLAGKQAGIKVGTRSGLLLEVERILEEQSYEERPKVLLLENVKALIGSKHKADFERWLNKLDQLGYNSTWKVLNAKDYGIPQNRERVFVLSWKKDINVNINLDNIISKKLETNLGDYLEKGKVDPWYKIDVEKMDAMMLWKAFERPLTKVNTVNSVDVGTLTTRSGEHTSSQKLVVENFNIESPKLNIESIIQSPSYSLERILKIDGEDHFALDTDVPYHDTKLMAIHSKYVDWLKEDFTAFKEEMYAGKIIIDGVDRHILIPDSEMIKIGQATNTVNKMGRVNGRLHFKLDDGTTRPYGYSSELGWCLPISNEYSSTIAQNDQINNLISKLNLNYIEIKPISIRKFTTREAMRLMGVSDDYIDRIFNYVPKKGAQFKLAGNSIVVNVLEEIFKLTKDIFKGEN